MASGRTDAAGATRSRLAAPPWARCAPCLGTVEFDSLVDPTDWTTMTAHDVRQNAPSKRRGGRSQAAVPEAASSGAVNGRGTASTGSVSPRILDSSIRLIWRPVTSTRLSSVAANSL